MPSIIQRNKPEFPTMAQPNPQEPIYTAPPPAPDSTQTSATTATTTTTPPLASAANISRREYIYFLPHPLTPDTPVPYTTGLPSVNPLNLPTTLFEPTSTLVLTSPARTFVDLRYLLPEADEADEAANKADEAASNLSSPSTTSPSLPNTGNPSLLSWGFAGTSTSTPSQSPPHPLYGAFAHATWTHWVDSRVPFGAAMPADKGDMYDLRADGLFLEHGWAFHPHLGRVAGHEELWRDEGVEGEGEGKSKVCIVLRVEDDEHSVRGVIVRVGQFCQGIIRVGDGITTERWERTLDRSDGGSDITAGAAKPSLGAEKPRDGAGAGAGESAGESADASTSIENEEANKPTWKRTARTGDAFLPCAVTFRPEVVRVGGKVQYAAFEWVVEEVWVWE